MKTTGIVVAAVLGAALVGCLLQKKPAEPVLASTESWCPDGFEAGPSDTCFAIPEAHDAGTPIVVFLHGTLMGRGSPTEWNLVRGATAKGFAVVVPRGRRDMCSLTAGQENSFCWPAEPEDIQSFKGIVASWDRVLWQVDALLEGGPHKRYVLGYGPGGAFAEFIATRGMFPAQGWAFVHASELAASPKAASKPPPMLLLATQDEPDDQAKTKALHDDLVKGGYPHASCARAGSRELASEDIDAALRFFDHDAKGQLKIDAKTSSYACEPGTKALAER